MAVQRTDDPTDIILLLIVIVFLCLAGCGAQIDERSRMDRVCTDTRDGEVFSFRGETMRNPRIDWADACVDVTDDSGNTRAICRSHEVWLKCEPDLYAKSGE